MKTFLFRHGESTFNTKDYIQGWSKESVLTEKGYLQSLKFANFFKRDGLDKLWSSDLPRAIQTAETMLTVLKDTKYSVSPLLREQGQGIFEGRPYTDPEWQAAKTRTKRQQEEGETKDAVLARMQEFFKDLVEKSFHGIRIGVICHGRAIDIFLDDIVEKHKDKILPLRQGDIAELELNNDNNVLFQSIFNIL